LKLAVDARVARTAATSAARLTMSADRFKRAATSLLNLPILATA
jgi:hypothetical protein